MVKFRALAGIGLSAMLVTGGVVMAMNNDAVAVERSDTKKAAGAAAKAQKALAKAQWTKAVAFAETAVAASPQDAGYRMLLGQAYLRAGRFASAESAFGDVLTLQPANGKAALNLALAAIAQGKWQAARTTLDAHAAAIPAADRGLAVALAGDPAAGIEILTAATRAPEADAKTRQNLALAMALGGRWQEARTLVSVDMTPDQTDQRIAQWAQFAHPSASSDQVASLLGVTPGKDPGQPMAIALNAAVPTASAAADPVEAFMPGKAPAAAEPAVAAAAPVAEPDAPAPGLASAAVSVPVPAATFAPQQEVVQPLPVAVAQTAPAPRAAVLIAAHGAYKAPVKVAAAEARKGDWYVQLGAYPNAAVARDGWARASRRYAGFAPLKPLGVTASVKGASFYRLSVGGFAHRDADAMCRSYRAKGGTCFVRQQVGEQTAAWVKGAKGSAQLASR